MAAKFRQNILIYILPGLVLLFFVLVMNGEKLYGFFIPFEQSFSSHALRLENDLQSQSWEAAAEDLRQLRASWQKARRHLQLAVERNKIEELDENMARLEALIRMREAPGALAELLAAENNWLHVCE